MSTLTWLHLSDSHFRESQAYDENVVLKALLRDVAEQEIHPDFIAVTGDIAFSGKPDQYHLAREFFEQLLGVTGLSRERLFVVPGNHDVDRSLVTAGARAIGDSLTDRKLANTLLATPADHRLLFARFAGYAAFVNDYLGDSLSVDDDAFFYVRTLNLAGQQVALLGLNSAWLCDSDDDWANRLLIGERQARTALDLAETAGATLKIVLLHHPFDWLREFDRRDSEAMLIDQCDFILHGHLHVTATTGLTSPDGAATVLACGACYETRDFPNMYNWVRLDLVNRTGTVHLRRYSDERGGFWARDTLTYRNVKDGTYRFTFGDGGGVMPPPLLRSKPAPDPVVHSFVEAAEALQSRLYNILNRGGLGALRRKYPSGEYAEEMLYLVARYFGWERILRKGAYATDDEVITPTEQIRDAFATGKYGTSVFEVYRPKQDAIGQLVVKRLPGTSGVDYEAMSPYDFQERLMSPPLSTEGWIVETLKALKEAHSVVDLPGRERLAVIQDALVGLLEYLEEREEYSVFPGKRKSALRASSSPAQPPVAGSEQTATATQGSAAAAGRGVAQTGSGNVAITGEVQGGVTITQSGQTAGTPPPVSAPVPSGDYNLAAVRDLLLEAFTAKDLRRLFLYSSNAELRTLTQEFSPGDGLADMVDKTVELCQTRRLLYDLLGEVQRANPRKYAEFAARLQI